MIINICSTAAVNHWGAIGLPRALLARKLIAKLVGFNRNNMLCHRQDFAQKGCTSTNNKHKTELFPCQLVRGDAHVLLKQTREILWRLKTTSETNLLDRQIGVAQELYRLVDAYLVEIVYGGHM